MIHYLFFSFETILSYLAALKLFGDLSNDCPRDEFSLTLAQIDIFQYSNMYTLKPSISRLASAQTVITECAPYVTRQGFTHAAWPTLLKLYSRLVPGVTIHQWVEAHDILALGIDPRRFVSFGIIKGFLRRVHRWPILQDTKTPVVDGEPSEPRRRVEFDDPPGGSSLTLSNKSAKSSEKTADALARSTAGASTYTLRSMESTQSLGVSPSRTGSSVNTKSPRRQHQGFTSVKELYPSIPSHTETNLTHPSASSRRGAATGLLKIGASRLKDRQNKQLEEDMVRMLDGMHHSDEIQVRFGIGWRELDKLLKLESGRGKEGIVVVYR